MKVTLCLSAKSAARHQSVDRKVGGFRPIGELIRRSAVFCVRQKASFGKRASFEWRQGEDLRAEMALCECVRFRINNCSLSFSGGVGGV